MFEVGQKVWHFGFGWGVVEDIVDSKMHQVGVRFSEAGAGRQSFTLSGKWRSDQARTLFFKEFTAPLDVLTPPFVPTLKADDVIKVVTRENNIYYYRVIDEEETTVHVVHPSGWRNQLEKSFFTITKVGEDHS